MRKQTIDFYTSLFRAGRYSLGSVAETLNGLPKLDKALAASLDSTLAFGDLTVMIMQTLTGKDMLYVFQF